MGMYNKHLTLVPIGGLANRFYAMTSALSFCLDNQIALKVIWFKDKGMGAGFHDLFNLDSSLRQDVAVVDAKWSDYIFDRPRKRNFWLPYISQRILFDKCYYEKDFYEKRFSAKQLREDFLCKDSIYLVHFNPFYSYKGMIKYISPISELQKRIDERRAQFNGHKVIGLHIRRGDHTTPTLGSPLNLFVQKMDQELKKDPDVLFYVASDSYEEKERLLSRFGLKVIACMDEVRRDNKEGIEDAVVELFTLASTYKIYGSLASTYSTLASDLLGNDLEILSLE